MADSGTYTHDKPEHVTAVGSESIMLLLWAVTVSYYCCGQWKYHITAVGSESIMQLNTFTATYSTAEQTWRSHSSYFPTDNWTVQGYNSQQGQKI
jgi:hypothetical protein